MDIRTTEAKTYVLAGKARSGKDTVANTIKKVCEENNLKHINLQYSFYLKEYAKKISNWDGNDNTKPRELLQFLGTELIRAQIDELFFINRMIEDIKVYSYFFDVITISDTRFKLEIDILKETFENIKSIQVIRPNTSNELSLTEQAHKSEVDLNDYNNFDYKIVNDKTLEDLEELITKVIKKDLIK